jgi:hypothetical protein
MAGKLWADTDDAIALLLPPQEAAQILGRSLQSVYHRRSLKDMGGANRDRKPRRKLRREYYSTGQGERDEAVPLRPRRKCRVCRREARYRLLCNRCYKRLWYLIRAGYISRAEVARFWP